MSILPPPINQTTGEPSWRWRRAMIFMVIAFCMGMLIWLVDRTDSELNGSIAVGCMWLIGVLALIYAGFATVQDVVAIIATRTGRPYADPPVPATPAAPDTVIVTAGQ